MYLIKNVMLQVHTRWKIVLVLIKTENWLVLLKVTKATFRTKVTTYIDFNIISRSVGLYR